MEWLCLFKAWLGIDYLSVCSDPFNRKFKLRINLAGITSSLYFSVINLLHVAMFHIKIYISAK